MMDASPGVPGINFRSSLRPYRRRRDSLILVCYALGRGRSITTKTDFIFYWVFSVVVEFLFCFYVVRFFYFGFIKMFVLYLTNCTV